VTFGWSGAWAELRAVDTAARAMVSGFVDLGAVSALPSPAFGKLVLDVRPPVAYGSERLTSTARDGWVGRSPGAHRETPAALA
jgi:NADPH:quinone reductase